MTILICRVAWMPRYQSDDEAAVGGGSYVDEGNVPHESLNFLAVGDTYYGFIENGRKQIRLERLGAQAGMRRRPASWSSSVPRIRQATTFW